jgi:hypothetical protein
MVITSHARIIALCGDEGAGKSHIARHSGRIVVSFADALRNITEAATGIPSEDLKEQRVKAMKLSSLYLFGDCRETVRDLMIGIAGKIREFNDDYFVGAVIDRLTEPGMYIIDDLRFANEARALRERFDEDELEIIQVNEGRTYDFRVDSVYINTRP